MCECKNDRFEIWDGKLQIWDDEYSAFYTAADDTYYYCPVCGENLKEKK